MNSSVSTAFSLQKSNTNQNSHYRSSSNGSTTISDYTKSQFSNFLQTNLFVQPNQNEKDHSESHENPAITNSASSYDELKSQFILNSYGAAVLRKPFAVAVASNNFSIHENFDNSSATKRPASVEFLHALNKREKRSHSPMRPTENEIENFREPRNPNYENSEHFSHLNRSISHFYNGEENSDGISERNQPEDSVNETSYSASHPISTNSGTLYTDTSASFGTESSKSTSFQENTTDIVSGELAKNCRRDEDYCVYPNQESGSSCYLNDALSSYSLHHQSMYDSNSVSQANSINHMVKAAAALGYHPSSLYGPGSFYMSTCNATRNAFHNYPPGFESNKRGDEPKGNSFSSREWTGDSNSFDTASFQGSNFFDPHGSMKISGSSNGPTSGSSAYGNSGEFSQNFSNYMLPGMNKFTNNHPDVTFGSSNNNSSSTMISGEAGNVTANIMCDTSMSSGGEIDYNPRELEAFAEKFKQRRIKLGVTQADVGKALGNLKIAGVGSLSQSTICRFESLTLSHNNMVALKPILQAWLEDAELEANMRLKSIADMYDSDEERKRKRTSITDSEKRSLEAFFGIQPRPSSEKIAQIAEKLNLKKNVVRVWFCNQRQKQKRMKFSTLGLLGYHSPGI